MIPTNTNSTVAQIKDVLSRQSYVLGVFLSKATVEESTEIKIFILISEDKFIEDAVKSVTTVQTDQVIEPDIWSLEAFQKADNEDIRSIFKEGKLIYWNAMVDILASQVFKVRPYTIFTFALKGLAQNGKAKFNYQLYGKKDNGLIADWNGQRLAKSCFYVPYAKKYRVIRFLNQNGIEFNQKEAYF